MHQLKDFFNFLDYIVATFCGITLVEVLPVLATNGITSSLTSSISELISTLFAFVGLIYLAFRCIHYVRMSKINVAIRKEELKKIERENFPWKWEDEFIKDK
tara:strand:+ start:101 stop:406 length:306 start_codon:yes stop_codon:yes gene_type:complete